MPVHNQPANTGGISDSNALGGLAGVGMAATSSSSAADSSGTTSGSTIADPPNMWSWVAIGVVGATMLCVVGGVIAFSVLSPGQARN